MTRYYIDTAIWIDFYEDRKGYNEEPLGDYAWRLLALIKSKRYKLIITDLLMKELELNYSPEEIKGMMKLFEDIIEKIISTEDQRDEAKKIAEKRDVPSGDALHAILARDNKLILISRDNHFRKLLDISKYYKPEELI